MQANPDPDRAGSEEPFQHLRGGPERSRRRREGDEEGIPLCVNFDAAMSHERLAENAAMLSKRVGISVGAKLVQQLRRALDVGEKEGDGSRWKIALHRRHHARAAIHVDGTDWLLAPVNGPSNR